MGDPKLNVQQCPLNGRGRRLIFTEGRDDDLDVSWAISFGTLARPSAFFSVFQKERPP
jgi:hypothetical protein